MIAVTGATGQLGRLVIANLLTRHSAEDIAALVRDPAKGADLGVPTRAFDYDIPDTLAQALTGVTKLLLISGSEVGKRVPQHKAVIAAATEAGVGQVIYTSLLNADTSEIALAPEHRETEAALKASGLDYVILRNTWYTENYTGSVGAAVESGAVIGSTGDGKLATASRPDLAEAAAIVLSSEGHSGKTYELANDEPFTLAQLADEIARQSGKPVVFNNLPTADYANLLESFGLPAPMATLLADSDEKASRGALFDDSRTLGTILGRPTQSLSDAVARALA